MIGWLNEDINQSEQQQSNMLLLTYSASIYLSLSLSIRPSVCISLSLYFPQRHKVHSSITLMRIHTHQITAKSNFL